MSVENSAEIEPGRQIVVGKTRDNWRGRSIQVDVFHNDFQSSSFELTPDEARDLAEQLLAYIGHAEENFT